MPREKIPKTNDLNRMASDFIVFLLESAFLTLRSLPQFRRGRQRHAVKFFDTLLDEKPHRDYHKTPMKNLKFPVFAIVSLCLPSLVLADSPCKVDSRKVLSLASSSKGPEGLFPVYPDFSEKIDLIAELDLPPEKKRALAYLGYLRQSPSFDFNRRSLLKNANLGREQMAFIKKHRLLEVDPLEYERLATVPPINQTYVRPGVRVSIVFSKYLENATVTGVEGGLVTVRLKRNREIKNLSILKNQLFWPIGPGRDVIIEGNDGASLRTVQYISEGNQVKLQARPNETDPALSTLQLGLTPRLAIKTGTPDLSRPIGEFGADRLQRDFDEIVELIKEISGMEGGTPWKNRAMEGLVGTINFLTDRLQKEMRRQGISVSSAVTVKDGPKILRIEGVHPNGNLPLRKILRQFERHFGREIVIAIGDTALRGVDIYHGGRQLVLGFQAILSLLKHRTHSTFDHHLRHQMFAAHREMRREMKWETGQTSLFDISFDSYGSPYDLYGKALSKDTPSRKLDRFMWFEEIPIYLGDAVNHAKALKDVPRDRIKKSAPLLNTLRDIEAISQNARDITGNILDDQGNVNQFMGSSYFENGMFHIADDQVRRVNVVLPSSLTEAVEGNLSQVLSSLSVNDLKDIEVIMRAKLIEYEYRIQIAPHLKFLASAPRPSVEAIGNYHRKKLSEGVSFVGLNTIYDSAKRLKVLQLRRQIGETIWNKVTLARNLARTVHDEITHLRQSLEAKTSLRRQDISKVLETLQNLRTHIQRASLQENKPE